MKFYVLIPIYNSKFVKIKERDYNIRRSTLTPDYSKYFGTENEYYLDLDPKKYKLSGRRDKGYQGGTSWYYNAFDPINVIKKKTIKNKEV